MPKPKSVMIDLSPKQREMLHKVTGQRYNEIELFVKPVSTARAAGRKLATKAAPSAKLGKPLGDYKVL